MAGRPKRLTNGKGQAFTMSPEHRVKIQNSKILNRLIGHVEGKIELSSTQVTAGLGLLRKVLPDMTESNTTHNVSEDFAKLVSALDAMERRGAIGFGDRTPGDVDGQSEIRSEPVRH